MIKPWYDEHGCLLSGFGDSFNTQIFWGYVKVLDKMLDVDYNWEGNHYPIHVDNETARVLIDQS